MRLPMLFRKPEYAKPPAPSPSIKRTNISVKELGASGSVITAGLLMDQDYNPDLRTPMLYHTYDRMRKSDGQVRSALSVIKLPLLSVDWFIEPASDDPQDVEIAKYIEDGLMNMTITWHNTLRQALLMLDYGALPYEKVWEIKDGLVNLRKLAPRMPQTITEWQVDDTGGLKGIKQNAWRNNTFEVIEIPVDKLLLFVNELEGSDYRGQSILRAAYKHWYYKDKLYIIDAISKERHGMGIDVGTLKGADADDDDRADLENALMMVHAHENQFFIEQEERYTYRVEGIQGNVANSLDSIEHHDLRILRSVLAEFLAMGAGSSGSLAMHKDKSSFFIMSLEAIATNVCDTFNRYLIPQWCDYNWKVGEAGYPRLQHSRLDTRDITALAESMAKFIDSGVLTPGRDLEEEVRSTLGLPELPEGTEAPPPVASPGLGDGLPELPEDLPPPALPNSRKHTFAKQVNFAAIGQALDKGEEDIVKSVKATQRKQIDRLAEIVFQKLKSGKLDELGDITVPYKNELADEIAKVLIDLFTQGRAQVQREVKMELGEEPDDIKTFLLMRAKATVGVLADRLKSSVVWNALAMFRDEPVTPATQTALKGVLRDLSDREIKKMAGNTVSEALNLGRDSAARGSKTKLSAVYSSVLDKGTCGACHSADGIKVKVGSADYDRLKPPYTECGGMSRCRCVFIYIGDED